MKCYSVVAVIALVVVVYAFSALMPLPWYLYLPFIAIFLLAYQGDTFVRQSVTIRQIFHRYLPHYQPSQGKHMGSKRM